VGTIRHLPALHRSAKVNSPPVRVTDPPTAVHEDGDGHDTAPRRLCGLPAGLADGSIRQVRPFQRSTSVTSRPDPMTELPTAVQVEGPVQDTPKSALTLAPARFGVGWMCHLRPFHRSARVTWSFVGVSYTPTAVHEDSPVHVPNSSWPVGACGFGIGVIDHPPEGAALARQASNPSGRAAPERYGDANRVTGQDDPSAAAALAKPQASATATATARTTKRSQPRNAATRRAAAMPTPSGPTALLYTQSQPSQSQRSESIRHLR
jgi:hypothetical protein